MWPFSSLCVLLSNSTAEEEEQEEEEEEEVLEGGGQDGGGEGVGDLENGGRAAGVGSFATSAKEFQRARSLRNRHTLLSAALRVDALLRDWAIACASIVFQNSEASKGVAAFAELPLPLPWGGIFACLMMARRDVCISDAEVAEEDCAESWGLSFHASTVRNCLEDARSVAQSAYALPSSRWAVPLDVESTFREMGAAQECAEEIKAGAFDWGGWRTRGGGSGEEEGEGEQRGGSEEGECLDGEGGCGAAISEDGWPRESTSAHLVHVRASLADQGRRSNAILQQLEKALSPAQPPAAALDPERGGLWGAVLGLGNSIVESVGGSYAQRLAKTKYELRMAEERVAIFESVLRT